MKCNSCGKECSISDSLFCPYCGEKLSCSEIQISDAERVWLKKIQGEENLIKKHSAINAAIALFPDSLPLHEEALYLGRLYERDGKHLNFSLIKCYLLQMYLTPAEFSDEQKSEMRSELFHGDELETCIRLSGRKEKYLFDYLKKLSILFIRTFLEGSTHYTKTFFGFRFDRRLEKVLAEPACDIICNMHADLSLNDTERQQLMTAFHKAFSEELGNDCFLNEKLEQIGIINEIEGGITCSN